MEMSFRNAVRALLSGQQPGQPLVDMGGRVASLSVPLYKNLKAHLGFGEALDDETITFLNTIGRFDEQILEYFQVPFRRLFLNPPSTFRLQIAGDGSFHDEWGVKYVPRGYCNERVGHPLAQASLKDLDTFSWPDPDEPGRMQGVKEEAERLYQDSSFSLVAGHISAGIFQDCWNLCGMHKFFEDMVLNSEFAEALLDRVAAIHIGLWKNFLGAIGEYVDMVETADDLGSQAGLLISPRMYRKYIKPRHTALNEAIRQQTQAKIFYHSCGAIMPIIDDLIESGVQVLTPIQPLPGLMDPEELKRKYAGRVIFHGGLDVQTLLPNAKPDEIRAHVRRYYDALGSDSYIMAPANTIQPGTPIKNILAAYEAALTYTVHD